MSPGDAASRSPFRTLVEQLRCCISEASQRRKASDVDTVSGAARGPSHEWTCVELLRLLQQYPAGVTAAVMETELLSQWRSRRKQHAAPKGSRRSNGSPLQSLAELLAPMQPGEARRVGTLQATVAGVEGAGSQGIGRAPHLLLLRDGSRDADAPPVGMYLHSRRIGLFAAGQNPQPAVAAGPGQPNSSSPPPADTGGSSPVIAAGAAIRFANVRVRNAAASTGFPPRLLPTAEMVVLARDRAEAAAVLRGMSVSGVAQVLATARVPPGQSVTMQGVMAGRIARIGELKAGVHSTQGLSSRTGSCLSVRIVDVSQRGASMELSLLDEQVAYAELLQLEDEVFVSHPAFVRRLSGAASEPDAAAALYAELTEETLLVAIPVPEDPVEEAFDDQENCAAAANSAAMAPRSAANGGAQHAALADRLLAGRVLSMQASELRGASSLALILQEDGDERSLRLNFLAKLTPAALALRPGHVVVIAGAVDGNPARSADARVAGSKVHSASVWHEGAEGALVLSLSALAAVLASPPLLTALRPLSEFMPPCPACVRTDLALCRATLAAPPHLQWRQVHSMCGRPVRRVSLGLDDLFGDEDMDAEPELPSAAHTGAAADGGDTQLQSPGSPNTGPKPQSTPVQSADEAVCNTPAMLSAAGARDVACLWRCGFCGVECSGGAVEAGVDAALCLTADGVTLEAQLDAAAVPALLGAPAAVFRRLGSAERRERLAALAGRRVVASLYAGIGHGAAVHIAAVRLLDAEAPPQSKQRRGR